MTLRSAAHLWRALARHLLGACSSSQTLHSQCPHGQCFTQITLITHLFYLFWSLWPHFNGSSHPQCLLPRHSCILYLFKFQCVINGWTKEAHIHAIVIHPATNFCVLSHNWLLFAVDYADVPFNFYSSQVNQLCIIKIILLFFA